MHLLRQYVRCLLEATEFDESLTPDVVGLLIRDYAEEGGVLGTLSWEYTNALPHNVWGRYKPNLQTLYVNGNKTKGLFKQQVQTILHEIQHWNQHVAMMRMLFDDELKKFSPSHVFNSFYQPELKEKGYWKNKYEINARDFADRHLEDAMSSIGRHYGGKIDSEGGLDEIIEELMNMFIDGDEKPLRRIQIGTALSERDMNSPENMKLAVAELIKLGVKIM